jgi:hypothetical protein
VKDVYSDVHPELDSVLRQFVAGVRNALGDNFFGAYLVGSLATGDFDLDSDVDFLVVTRGKLRETELQSLRETHAAVHALGCYPAQHLEGSYIPVESVNRAESVGTEPLWYVDNGSTTLERSLHDNRWHVRWILREKGIVIAGPAPNTFVRAVPADALRAEAADGIAALLGHVIADLDRPRGWFTTRFGQSFAVLTGCRMLHTRETGEVQSKAAAAKWAERFLDPAWHELIQAAWAERAGVRFGEKVHQPAESRTVQATAQFLAYTQGFVRAAGGSSGDAHR